MKEESFEEWFTSSPRVRRVGSDSLALDSIARMLWLEVVEPSKKKIDELQKDEDGLSRDYHFMTVEFVKIEKELAQVKKVNELRREALTDLLFHCMDYGTKEESLAILMACEKARECEVKIRKGL